eukprot:jgi/Picsp_1/2201/NSC_05665-R1_prolyl 4-hydroxylase alpha subunit
MSQSRRKARTWLNSYRKVSQHLEKWSLDEVVDRGNGIAKISNFLPEIVAEEILDTVKGIPEGSWLKTEAEEDYARNDISHSFVSTKSGNGIEMILRIFGLLYPDSLHVFSAARYSGSKGDHIDRHDDRAYVNVTMTTGEIVQCSRSIAIIFYLTKDWSREMGGLLIDCETGDEFVPEFNSLVAFRIPRFHVVTPVVPPHERYSIFGWILEPGKLYQLNKDVSDGRVGVNSSDNYGTDYPYPLGNGEQCPPATFCKLAKRILQSHERKTRKKNKRYRDE